MDVAAIAVAPVGFAGGLVNPIERRIERVEQTCLGLVGAGANFYQRFGRHEKRDFDCAVVSPKTDAAFRRFEAAGYVGKIQGHGCAGGAAFAVAFKNLFLSTAISVLEK